jgi:hypothetical protein
MPEIKIKVRDKCAEGEGVVICNNSDYTVAWDLDGEWTPYDTKTMRVNLTDGGYQDVVFTGNTAALPVLSTPGWVSVGLYAGDIHTSRAARLLALSSVLTPGGSPAVPAEDVYAQIMAKLNELSTVSPEDIAKAVEDYLTEHPAASASMRVEGGYIQFSGDGKTWENVIALADLKGAPGSPGSPGSPGKDGLTPHIGDNGNWYLGDTDTGKPARGTPGAKGDPGKDGAGMDVTGAAVGQIAVVAAVDDNGVPTAWVAQDLPSGGGTWKKVVDTITEEEASSIEVTKDIDGNDLNIKKCIIFTIAAPSASNTEKKVRIVSINNKRVSYEDGGVYTETYFTQVIFKCNFYPYVWYRNTRFFFGYSNNPAGITTLMGNAVEVPFSSSGENEYENITAIVLESNGILGVGSRILVYELEER